MKRALLVLLVFVAPRATSQIPSPVVSISEDKITLNQALDELRKQTGAKVAADLEGERAFPLRLEKATFWQALAAIEEGAKARVVLPSRDGPISLVQAAPTDRKLPASYDGAFRVRIIRVAGNRDLTTDYATTTMTLEIAWAPWVQPLFLDTHVQGALARDAGGKVMKISEDGGTLVAIDGRSFTTQDITLIDVPRAQPMLSLLAGRLTLVAPSKMLLFRFDGDLKTLQSAAVDGAIRRLAQEDVVCRVERLTFEKERWSIRMALDYPEGGRALESFQAGSLVANNELILAHRDGKRTLTPSASGIDVAGSRRAVVTYHFRDAQGRRLGRPEDWRPIYRAPAKIVDVPVTFRFLKAPLP